MFEDGPGGRFEVNDVWYVGDSFDALHGERWESGVSVGFTDGFNTDVSSIKPGLCSDYRMLQYLRHSDGRVEQRDLCQLRRS